MRTCVGNWTLVPQRLVHPPTGIRLLDVTKTIWGWKVRHPQIQEVGAKYVDYIKSLAMGTLLAFVGVATCFASMLVVGGAPSNSVSVDIRSLRSSYFWIPAAILFFAGFYLKFRRLRRP
jgi:hypothetical protein